MHVFFICFNENLTSFSIETKFTKFSRKRKNNKCGEESEIMMILFLVLQKYFYITKRSIFSFLDKSDIGSFEPHTELCHSFHWADTAYDPENRSAGDNLAFSIKFK